MNTCPLDLLEQECWLKTLCLIYDTLYALALASAAETQHARWSASLDQTSGKKKKKGVSVACQKMERRPLHVTNLWRNVNDCQSSGVFFLLWGSFHSFAALKRFHLCLWSMYYLITKRETEISRGWSLGAITRLGQHSRLSDKVCLYLALPPLVFLLRFNLRAAPKPLLLF